MINHFAVVLMGCYWPTYLRTDAAKTKAVFNYVDLVTEMCSTCPVVVKYKTAYYEKAKDKMKVLENASGVSSSDSEISEVPLTHRAPKRNSQMDDYIQNFSEDDLDEIPQAPKLPKKSASAVRIKSLHEYPSGSSTPTRLNSVSCSPSIRSSDSPHNTTVTLNSNGVMDILQGILKQQEHMQRDIRRMLHIMQQQQNKDNNKEDLVCTDKWEAVVTFQELKDLDAKLNSEAYMSETIKMFAIIGGKDLTDTCRRILTKILSNEVACAINWSGRNQKESFCSLTNVITLIVVAVRKNPLCKDASKKDVEDCIKLWLRNAGDRDGGRNRRKNRQTV